VKKIFLVIFSIVILAVVFVLSIGFLLSPQNKLEPSDAIVIVSGGETSQRVAEGVKLYKDGWASILIMSGAARNENVSNAQVMKQLAVKAGIDSQQILVEEESTNTFENAAKTKSIIIDHEFSKIILITSPYHQRRAFIVFKNAFKDLSIKIINHSSTDSIWRKNGWWKEAWSRHITFSELQKIIYTWLVSFQCQ